MENKGQKIIFVHLFNNFSGSPNVLAGVVRYFYRAGYDVTLLTSFNNEGFLSDVPCTRKINVPYTFVSKPLMLMLHFLQFQLVAACKIITLKGKCTVYLNTIQPFLPAIAARLRGFRVVYHVHEAYPKPKMMSRFLFFVLNHTAHQLVCVSEYVRKHSGFKYPERTEVLYNSLSESFKAQAEQTIGLKFKDKAGSASTKSEGVKRKILMVSSSRPYKGIFAFCELARQMPEFIFVLVCDASPNQVKKMFSAYENVKNLEIHSTKCNLHPFYEMADMIVNLTDCRLIVETFGLTILEGMYYGLPAIVPTVGGITELVDNGRNGYQVDMYQTEALTGRIREVLGNDTAFHRFTNASFDKYQELESRTDMSRLFQIVLK